MLVPNYMSKKMDAYLVSGHVVESVSDLILLKRVIKFLDETGEPMLELEIHSRSSARLIKIPLLALSSQETASDAFLGQLYFISFKYVNHLRDYIIDAIQQANQESLIEYRHSSLGFFEYNNKLYFLLDRVKLENIESVYFNPSFTFRSGEARVFDSLIEDHIVKSPSMSLALTLGLSSVVASYLKDYADVQNLIVNISGPSSTGKTTAAMFIASLWGSPSISNKGIVRTFNATVTSMFTSIEGVNGVPIIFDDITTSGSVINKTSFLYTLAQGESKARATTSGRLQYQGPQWSGTIIITSETSILNDSETRQGLLARVIDTSDITWTKSAAHSEAIKKVILGNHGFIGAAFTSAFLKKEDSQIRQMFEDSKRILEKRMKLKDNLSNRILNKLAILYLTAMLIKDILGYGDFNLDVMADMIVNLDQSTVEGRHPAEKALTAIVLYVIENHQHFNKSNSMKGSQTLAKGKTIGDMKFKGSKLFLTIPTEKIKEILEDNRIYEHKPIFKYWREHGLVITQEENRTSVKDARFQTRVIKFVFKKGDDLFFPWEALPEPSGEPPTSNINFDDQAAIDAIFEDETDEN
jgi:hypothetical protein